MCQSALAAAPHERGWLARPCLVNAVFETPAQTARGVLEKVRILYIARGDFDQQGDDDLEDYQDAKNNPWFGSVIADLERLAGEARS